MTQQPFTKSKRWGEKEAGMAWYGMGETIFKPELEKAREHNMIL